MPDVDTREAVAEAIRKAAGGSEPEDVGEGGAPEAAEVEDTTAPQVEVAPSRERDESGRFKPAKGAPTPTAPQAQASGAQADTAAPPPPSAGPVVPALKPPADWRAGPKSEWEKLSRPVQEEAIRLHVEAKKLAEERAQFRTSAETWQKATQPYEHIFRAAGQTPEQGVGSVLQTYAALHTAPMPVRAGIVAQLVRNFLGTDEGSLRLLAGELDKPGSGPHGAPAAPQPQGLTPADVERLLAEREQKREQEAASREWQAFEASQPEYLDNVRVELASLVGAWLQRNPGQKPTKEVFQKLHEKALAMNEETAPIIAQRKEAAKARASTPPAAGVGIKSEPAGPSASGPAQDTREEVRRQLSKLKQRRV